MLIIAQDLIDAMVAHARADHPDEACGVIAGPAGQDRPERFVPMVNAAGHRRSTSSTRWTCFASTATWMPRDEEPVVVYHSHTATEAYPSRTDISYASEPQAHYLLVSTREPAAEEIRSLRIVDGVATEEEVSIVSTINDRPAKTERYEGRPP